MMGSYFEDDLSDAQKTYIIRHEKMLREQYESHRGEWLTDEACVEYRNRALKVSSPGMQDVDGRRRIRMELQEKYDLTEMESINIINGERTLDYVARYKLIRAVETYDLWFEKFMQRMKAEFHLVNSIHDMDRLVEEYLKKEKERNH